MVWNAGGTDTKMTQNAGGRKGIKPEVAVNSILKDVGKAAVSDGLISHQIMHYLLRTMFPTILGCMGAKMAIEQRKIAKEKKTN